MPSQKRGPIQQIREEDEQDSDMYLEKALRFDPTDSATRRNLAWNQFELGELEPAKANLARVLKETPHDATAILLLGMVEEESQNLTRALKLLASVPEQVRQRPESLAALARSYYYSGQQSKSREILKELQSRSAGPEGTFVAAQVAAGTARPEPNLPQTPEVVTRPASILRDRTISSLDG